MSEIVLIMGYPASGKSSLAAPFEKQGYVRLSRDTEGGKVVDLIPKLRNKFQSGQRRFVLDNLFPSIRSREPFIRVAHEIGLPIRCLWVNTSIEDAQLNACLRLVRKYGRLLDSHEINNDPNAFPIAVIYKYRKEFERPTEQEGFVTVSQTGFHRQWGAEYRNKAIILDYDGTVRKSRGNLQWPEKPSDIELLPGRANILKLLQKNYLLLGVSNQSACSKGLSLQSAIDCFNKTNELLGITIDYLFCPHRAAPPSCWCRKPSPGLAAMHIEKYKLNPKECIFVGDQTSDKTFAQRAGFQFMHAVDFFDRGKAKNLC